MVQTDVGRLINDFERPHGWNGHAVVHSSILGASLWLLCLSWLLWLLEVAVCSVLVFLWLLHVVAVVVVVVLVNRSCSRRGTSIQGRYQKKSRHYNFFCRGKPSVFGVHRRTHPDKYGEYQQHPMRCHFVQFIMFMFIMLVEFRPTSDSSNMVSGYHQVLYQQKRLEYLQQSAAKFDILGYVVRNHQPRTRM